MKLLDHLLARMALGGQGLALGSVVLAQSAVQVVHTGNTNETILATIPIAAGLIGATGALLIEPVWSHTSSINNKTMRARLGGIAGAIIFSKVNAVSTASEAPRIVLANRNAQNSQISAYSAGSDYYSGGAAAPATHAVDTAVAQDLVLTGQLASAGEQVRLEYYRVTLLRS